METVDKTNESIDNTSWINLTNTTNGVLVSSTDYEISNKFAHQLNVDQDEFLEDVLITLSPLKSIKLGSFSIDTYSLIGIIKDIKDIGGYSNGEQILLNQLRTWHRDRTRARV